MNVLIADDDPHVRSAVRLLLEDEPGISIVAEWATVDGLVEQVVGSESDVMLVDWDLPGLRNGTALRRLWSDAPGCRLVALSGRPEERDEALRSGAVSFVCKGDAPDSLLAVLRRLRVERSESPPRSTAARR